MNQLCRNILAARHSVSFAKCLTLQSQSQQQQHLHQQAALKPLLSSSAMKINSMVGGSRAALAAACIASFQLTAQPRRSLITSTTPSGNDFGYKQRGNNSFQARPDYQRGGYGGGYRSPRINERKSEFDFENAEPIEVTGQSTSYTVAESFEKFDLPAELLQRMNELGYTKPYEIQEATLPYSLAGKDLVGKAFTGSGKTLAFAIPIITRILKSDKQSRYPRCLVLSPTRELCLQLSKAIQELAPQLKCVSVFGGTDYQEQISALSGKVDIVCATPGRLRDLMQRKTFVADDIEIICLDEADELLTPNFLEQIKDVIEISNKKQMMMFSATINKNVDSVIRQYMEDPIMVDLTKNQKHKLPANIDHYLVQAPQHSNFDLILKYLTHFESDRCIVFTNTKKDAIQLSYQMQRAGIRSSDLHSDISQLKRQNILDKFRQGTLKVLIATDVAARGIDVPEVNLVIQAGAPQNGVDFYIHRSGRTGRGGRPGTSVLINNDEYSSTVSDLNRLVRFKQLDSKITNPSKMSSHDAEVDPEDDDKYIRKPSRDFRDNGYDRRSSSSSGNYGSSSRYGENSSNRNNRSGDSDVGGGYNSRSMNRTGGSFDRYTKY